MPAASPCSGSRPVGHGGLTCAPVWYAVRPRSHVREVKLRACRPGRPLVVQRKPERSEAWPRTPAPVFGECKPDFRVGLPRRQPPAFRALACRPVHSTCAAPHGGLRAISSGATTARRPLAGAAARTRPERSGGASDRRNPRLAAPQPPATAQRSVPTSRPAPVAPREAVAGRREGRTAVRPIAGAGSSSSDFLQRGNPASLDSDLTCKLCIRIKYTRAIHSSPAPSYDP